MDALLLFVAFSVSLMLFLTLNVPVGVSLGIIGILGTVIFISPAAVSQIANIAYTQSSSFVLLVVPLFVMMGEVIAVTGLGSALYRAASIWTRRLPGGLAVGTVGACAVFGSVCGSSPVTAATIGSISIPEMVRNGYDKRLAFGATAAGGTLGILIPPSVPMILYGIITGTSIGKLFIAGIVPGLIIAALLSLLIIACVSWNPELAPRIRKGYSKQEKLASFVEAGPIVLIAISVIAAIYAGIATPTEAGGLGAAAALLVAAVLGRLTFRRFGDALDRTMRTTAMFMLLLIGGLFASFLLARLGVPAELSRFLAELNAPTWLILVIINLFLLVLGMVLDPLSILVIVVPIFLPLVVHLGYDPIWFGIIVTIQVEIAAITPPVGFNLFVLRTAIPDSDLKDITIGSLLFIAPLLFAILLFSIFPEIVMYLPDLVTVAA